MKPIAKILVLLEHLLMIKTSVRPVLLNVIRALQLLSVWYVLRVII